MKLRAPRGLRRALLILAGALLTLSPLGLAELVRREVAALPTPAGPQDAPAPAGAGPSPGAEADASALAGRDEPACGPGAACDGALASAPVEADAHADGPVAGEGFFFDRFELGGLMAALLLSIPADEPGPVTAQDAIGVAPVLVAQGPGIVQPLFVAAPRGDQRIFIVERRGRIKISNLGVIQATPFLDIQGQVGTSGEQGLLGLAFDPNHEDNGRFYVIYTDNNGDTHVSRFTLGADPNQANPATEEQILFVDQPADNHNGGTVAFHPNNGLLYIGLGDGGGQNDPDERAQNPQQLLGKMLRVNVSGNGPGYSIPNSNPFRNDNNVRSEIWALGLRNPYRFAFDWSTGDLWIADVGQGGFEEVDFEPSNSNGGRNWGWDVMEGTDVLNNDVAQPPYVNAPPFDDPEYEYGHSNGRCSITGGNVYRGSLASVQGEYFFGDFCTGEIWSYLRSTQTVTDRTGELGAAAGKAFQLVGFGEDGFQALYIVNRGTGGNSYEDGTVHRVGPTGTECSDNVDNDGDGATDGADGGCANANDPSERDPNVACDDGYDNDKNNAIDFPDDTGCTSAADADESGGQPGGGGGGGGGNGSGGGCGLGFELVLLLPPLLAWRSRRRRATA